MVEFLDREGDAAFLDRESEEEIYRPVVNVKVKFNELNELDAKLTQIRQKIENVKTALSSNVSGDTRKGLQVEYTSLLNQQSSLITNIDKINRSIQTTKTRIAEIKQDLATINRQLSTLQSDPIANSSSIQRLQTVRSNLISYMGDASNQMLDLPDRAKQKFDNLNKTLEYTSREMSNLNFDDNVILTFSAAVDKAIAKISQYKDKISEVRALSQTLSDAGFSINIDNLSDIDAVSSTLEDLSEEPISIQVNNQEINTTIKNLAVLRESWQKIARETNTPITIRIRSRDESRYVNEVITPGSGNFDYTAIGRANRPVLPVNPNVTLPQIPPYANIQVGPYDIVQRGFTQSRRNPGILLNTGGGYVIGPPETVNGVRVGGRSTIQRQGALVTSPAQGRFGVSQEVESFYSGNQQLLASTAIALMKPLNRSTTDIGILEHDILAGNKLSSKSQLQYILNSISTSNKITDSQRLMYYLMTRNLSTQVMDFPEDRIPTLGSGASTTGMSSKEMGILRMMAQWPSMLQQSHITSMMGAGNYQLISGTVRSMAERGLVRRSVPISYPSVFNGVEVNRSAHPIITALLGNNPSLWMESIMAMNPVKGFDITPQSRRLLSRSLYPSQPGFIQNPFGMNSFADPNLNTWMAPINWGIDAEAEGAWLQGIDTKLYLDSPIGKKIVDNINEMLNNNEGLNPEWINNLLPYIPVNLIKNDKVVGRMDQNKNLDQIRRARSMGFTLGMDVEEFRKKDSPYNLSQISTVQYLNALSNPNFVFRLPMVYADEMQSTIGRPHRSLFTNDLVGQGAFNQSILNWSTGSGSIGINRKLLEWTQLPSQATANASLIWSALKSDKDIQKDPDLMNLYESQTGRSYPGYSHYQRGILVRMLSEMMKRAAPMLSGFDQTIPRTPQIARQEVLGITSMIPDFGKLMSYIKGYEKELISKYTGTILPDQVNSQSSYRSFDFRGAPENLRIPNSWRLYGVTEGTLASSVSAGYLGEGLTGFVKDIEDEVSGASTSRNASKVGIQSYAKAIGLSGPQLSANRRNSLIDMVLTYPESRPHNWENMIMGILPPEMVHMNRRGMAELLDDPIIREAFIKYRKNNLELVREIYSRYEETIRETYGTAKRYNTDMGKVDGMYVGNRKGPSNTLVSIPFISNKSNLGLSDPNTISSRMLYEIFDRPSDKGGPMVSHDTIDRLALQMAVEDARYQKTRFSYPSKWIDERNTYMKTSSPELLEMVDFLKAAVTHEYKLNGNADEDIILSKVAQHMHKYGETKGNLGDYDRYRYLLSENQDVEPIDVDNFMDWAASEILHQQKSGTYTGAFNIESAFNEYWKGQGRVPSIGISTEFGDSKEPQDQPEYGTQLPNRLVFYNIMKMIETERANRNKQRRSRKTKGPQSSKRHWSSRALPGNSDALMSPYGDVMNVPPDISSLFSFSPTFNPSDISKFVRGIGNLAPEVQDILDMPGGKPVNVSIDPTISGPAWYSSTKGIQFRDTAGITPYNIVHESIHALGRNYSSSIAQSIIDKYNTSGTPFFKHSLQAQQNFGGDITRLVDEEFAMMMPDFVKGASREGIANRISNRLPFWHETLTQDEVQRKVNIWYDTLGMYTPSTQKKPWWPRIFNRSHKDYEYDPSDPTRHITNRGMAFPMYFEATNSPSGRRDAITYIETLQRNYGADVSQLKRSILYGGKGTKTSQSYFVSGDILIPNEEMEKNKQIYNIKNAEELARLMKGDMGSAFGNINSSGKTYVETMKNADSTTEQFIRHGNRLGNMSWQFTNLQMAALGVYFSMMSIVNLMSSSLHTLGGSLMDTESAIQNYALAGTSTGGFMSGSSILDMFGINTTDMAEASLRLKDWVAGIQTIFAAFTTKLVLDPRVNETMRGIQTTLSDVLSKEGEGSAFENTVKLIQNLGGSLNYLISDLPAISKEFANFSYALGGFARIAIFAVEHMTELALATAAFKSVSIGLDIGSRILNWNQMRKIDKYLETQKKYSYGNADIIDEVMYTPGAATKSLSRCVRLCPDSIEALSLALRGKVIPGSRGSVMYAPGSGDVIDDRMPKAGTTSSGTIIGIPPQSRTSRARSWLSNNKFNIAGMVVAASLMNPEGTIAAGKYAGEGIVNTAKYVGPLAAGYVSSSPVLSGVASGVSGLSSNLPTTPEGYLSAGAQLAELYFMYKMIGGETKIPASLSKVLTKGNIVKAAGAGLVLDANLRDYSVGQHDWPEMLGAMGESGIGTLLATRNPWYAAAGALAPVAGTYLRGMWKGTNVAEGERGLAKRWGILPEPVIGRNGQVTSLWDKNVTYGKTIDSQMTSITSPQFSTSGDLMMMRGNAYIPSFMKQISMEDLARNSDNLSPTPKESKYSGDEQESVLVTNNLKLAGGSDSLGVKEICAKLDAINNKLGGV